MNTSTFWAGVAWVMLFAAMLLPDMSRIDRIGGLAFAAFLMGFAAFIRGGPADKS